MKIFPICNTVISFEMIHLSENKEHQYLNALKKKLPLGLATPLLGKWFRRVLQPHCMLCVHVAQITIGVSRCKFPYIASDQGRI